MILFPFRTRTQEGANKASSDPVVHLVDLPMQTSFGRFKGKELDTRGAGMMCVCVCVVFYVCLHVSLICRLF